MSEVARLVSPAPAELKASLAAQDRVNTRLEMTLQQGLQHLPTNQALPTNYRRAHRPAIQRKIDADLELRTVIRARIDRLTFGQIEAEAALHFAPAHCFRRSAIHAWGKCETKDRSKSG